MFQEKPGWSLPPEPPAPSVDMTVIAEYNYTPMTPQDLELRKDEEYTILEMSDSNWWRAKDKYGWDEYDTKVNRRDLASELKESSRNIFILNMSLIKSCLFFISINASTSKTDRKVSSKVKWLRMSLMCLKCMHFKECITSSRQALRDMNMYMYNMYVCMCKKEEIRTFYIIIGTR